MPEPAWPLHPPPEDKDDLRRYVERLARAYGVSFETFCFNALNIAHEDEEAFVAPAAVEALDEAVLTGLPGVM